MLLFVYPMYDKPQSWNCKVIGYCVYSQQCTQKFRHFLTRYQITLLPYIPKFYAIIRVVARAILLYNNVLNKKKKYSYQYRVLLLLFTQKHVNVRENIITSSENSTNSSIQMNGNNLETTSQQRQFRSKHQNNKYKGGTMLFIQVPKLTSMTDNTDQRLKL